MESPNTGEERGIRERKLDVLLSGCFADINWLCFLIRHGKIKDATLVNTFKNQIIEWYRLFGEEMSLQTVLDKESYHDFKTLYEKLVDEKNKKSDEDRSSGWLKKLDGINRMFDIHKLKKQVRMKRMFDIHKLKKLVRIKRISHISRRLYYTVRGVIEKY
ncbi:MAG: hypothetical protein ABR515_06415 [Nitrososphaeraceae archaeon]